MSLQRSAAHSAVSLTIDISTTDTGVANIIGMKIFVLVTPAVITGATFAILVGQLPDGSDAKVLVDDAGNALTFTATDDRSIVIDTEAINLALAAAPYAIFRSASSEAAARSLVLLCSA